MQGASQRDVVDVVAGGLRQRTGLAPTGDTAVDQLWLPLQTHIRAQSERLHDAGSKALDQHVGPCDQPQRDLTRFRPLEVQRDGLASPRQHVAVARGKGCHAAWLARFAWTVNADDPRAMIGQHHAGEGRWPQSGKFDYGEVG